MGRFGGGFVVKPIIVVGTETTAFTPMLLTFHLRLYYGVGGRVDRIGPDRSIATQGPSVPSLSLSPPMKWLIPPQAQISMTTLHIHQDPRF